MKYLLDEVLCAGSQHTSDELKLRTICDSVVRDMKERNLSRVNFGAFSNEVEGGNVIWDLKTMKKRSKRLAIFKRA